MKGRSHDIGHDPLFRIFFIFSERELTATVTFSCTLLRRLNFRQCFNAIWYVGPLWLLDKNFTEIVAGELYRVGVKPKRGSQI